MMIDESKRNELSGLIGKTLKIKKRGREIVIAVLDEVCEDRLILNEIMSKKHIFSVYFFDIEEIYVGEMDEIRFENPRLVFDAKVFA